MQHLSKIAVGGAARATLRAIEVAAVTASAPETAAAASAAVRLSTQTSAIKVTHADMAGYPLPSGGRTAISAATTARTTKATGATAFSAGKTGTRAHAQVGPLEAHATPEVHRTEREAARWLAIRTIGSRPCY